MDNDFNTAQAVALLFNLSDTILKITDIAEKQKAAKVLQYYANVLGLTLADDRQKVPPTTAAKLIDLLLQLRTEAKEKKDYKTSDMIRTALTEHCINVMDSKAGSTWEIS